MRCALVALALSAVLGTACAQPVALPRAKTPVTLCDPGKPDAWTGLKVTAARLEGQPAMQFSFPKYEQGQNEWPAVYRTCDAGQMDWSHHAIVAFDASTSSDQAEDLALELRGVANQNGVTVHQPILPGKTNHIAIVLADLAPQVDLEHIEEIVFFTTRPLRGHTVSIANFRLEPGQRPPLTELRLAYPNYRDLVFPRVNSVTVQATLHTEEYPPQPEGLGLKLTCRAGGKTTTAATKLRADGKCQVRLDKLPAGPVELTATITGESLDQPLTLSRSLQKLSSAEVKSLKVYIDENNTTIVDGKPFFPLGFYGNGQLSQMREMADGPFNCILDYGTNAKPRAEMLQYLDEMQQRGLKMIYSSNDLYPSAPYYEGKEWEGISDKAQRVEAVIKSYRDHPALLAWYLNDERPRDMVPEFTEYYQRFRSLDPNHPAYIVLCNMAELTYFMPTTDVMGVDPYPIPSSPVTRVVDWMEASSAATAGKMPTWLVPQAFAWYQHHPVGSDRARVPTEEDLRTGRAPTYEESRCMTYLGLAHGAKGLIYWCYYNLRMLPQYEEMWAEMKRIGAEVKALSPVLLAPDDRGTAKFSPPSAPIHTKVKRHEGREYLIAVSAGNEPCEVTFDLGRALPAAVKVLFEDRTMPAKGRALPAQFQPLEAHVYDLGPVAK